MYESSHTSISNIAAALNVYGETCKRASELWNTVRRDIEANYIGNLKTAKITDAKKVYDDTVAKAKEDGFASCISELDDIRAKCKDVASMPVPDDFTATIETMKTIKNPSANECTMILDKYKGNYLAYRAALNVISPKASITTLDDVLDMCDTLQALIQKAFNNPISDYNFRMLTNEGYMANYDAAFTAFTTCHFDAADFFSDDSDEK